MKIVKKLLITCFTILILIAGFIIYNNVIKKPSLVEVKPEPMVEEPKVIENKLSLIMAGDALIHQAVYNDAKIDNNNYDFKKMMPKIKEIVSKYDLAYINQETVIGGKALGLSTYPRFNSPEEIGDALLDAGFNIFGLANNHTLDRGETAIINSYNYWKDKNVVTAGSYISLEERNNVNIYEKNGIKYAFLSYTTWDNGLKAPLGKEYLINLYDNETAKKDIDAVRDKVDIIMVAMHWGHEYWHSESANQVEIAEYLSSLGVNIIVGTHPHVVQPITYINNTLVIYSLGNFISAQIGEERLVGALASIDITKRVEDGHANISFDNLGVDMIYTKYNNFRNFEVIPFQQLDDSILPNHQNVFEKYKKIITKYDNNIIVR